MANCPACGENIRVHETEGYDELYCEHCSYEERVPLARPRPLKVLEGEATRTGWRMDIEKQSHPARKGYRAKREREGR